MNSDLIGPAASLAAALLARHKPLDAQLTNEVIASAFEQAVQALQQGIQRVDHEEELRRQRNRSAG